MRSYEEYYTLELSQQPPQPEVVELMEHEGCPFCTRSELVAASPAVVLTCTDKECRHATHLECIAAPFWVRVCVRTPACC